MPDSIEAERNERVEWVVLGKLGDHAKKLVELELLTEKEPQYNKSVKIQMEALREVIVHWPLDANQQLSVHCTIVALADTMRGMEKAEHDLYDLCSSHSPSVEQLVCAVSVFKHLKQNAKNLLSHLNTMGEER